MWIINRTSCTVRTSQYLNSSLRFYVRQWPCVFLCISRNRNFTDDLTVWEILWKAPFISLFISFFLSPSFISFLLRLAPSAYSLYVSVSLLHLITLRNTTVGRTPLYQGSVRRRDLSLTTHNSHKRQIFSPPAGFEPAINRYNLCNTVYYAVLLKMND